MIFSLLNSACSSFICFLTDISLYFFELLCMLSINIYNIKKNKNVPTTCQWCQRHANGANDVLTVPFMYIQKFSTKFSTLGANWLLLALIELYAQIVTILLMLISPNLVISFTKAYMEIILKNYLNIIKT